MERNMENTTEASDLKDKKINVGNRRDHQQQPTRRHRHRQRPHRNSQQPLEQLQPQRQQPQQPQQQSNNKQAQPNGKDSDGAQKKQKSKRRNRRPRHKENEGVKATEKANKDVVEEEEEPENLDKEVPLGFNLSELLREAQALEKQTEELQTQLKIDYTNQSSDKQARVVSHVVAEQIAATEDEIGYVRQSLKRIYRRMITVDPDYAIDVQINEKLWRNIFYVSIEELRQKLRAFDAAKPKSSQQQKLQKLQMTLSDQIEGAFEFYHELNQSLKSTYQLKDSKLFGINVMTASYENAGKEGARQEQQRRYTHGRKERGSTEHKMDEKEKLARFLRSNYIHMGDLARYHAQQYHQQQHPIAKQKSKDYWGLAKTCYQKAIDVYRKDGWPYSQLALVSISNGNAMDVVWYYCMSLAVQYPSSLGRDNLKSFYSRIRFSKLALANSNSDDKIEESLAATSITNKCETATDQISLFVESFLHMHKTVMFNDTGSFEDFPKMLSTASQLGRALSSIISTATSAVDDPKAVSNTGALLSIVRTTLTRCITVLLISIWIAQERAKDHSKTMHRPVIQASQIHMFTFSSQLLLGVLSSFSNLSTVTIETEVAVEESNKDNTEAPAITAIEQKKMLHKLQRLRSKVEDTLLPGLSIWFTFMQHNITVLQQFISSSSGNNSSASGTALPSASEMRHPHFHFRKDLVKSLQALLTLVIQNPSFPQNVNITKEEEDNNVNATLPVTEDIILLGLQPLSTFHRTIDFSALTLPVEQQQYSRQKVRWNRIYGAIDTFAKTSSSLDLNIQNVNGSFKVVEDERVARQQKFMRALATQRLLEQVSSLEKNVDRMKLPRGSATNHQQQQQQAPNPADEEQHGKVAKEEEAEPKQPLAKHVYTCVVDLTCFLDALPKVKRWSQYHSPYVTEENENTIIEVVVPLDVIDELDRHKKGTAHMNMQARESIRYLDQILASAKTRKSTSATSYLRTQKVFEKWAEWTDLKKFWIGEESRSKVVDDLLLSTSDDNESDSEEHDHAATDTESIESDNSFIISSRRKGRRMDDTDDEEEEAEEAYTSDEDELDEDGSSLDSDNADEEYYYEEDFEDEEDEEETPYTYSDVPRKYRPIINCLLYYFDKQKQQQDYPQADKLVLVTNDADLAWWAELFGDPQTRRRLNVKTVNEWDAFVNKL